MRMGMILAMILDGWEDRSAALWWWGMVWLSTGLGASGGASWGIVQEHFDNA
jgi:hypothetical protein